MVSHPHLLQDYPGAAAEIVKLSTRLRASLVERKKITPPSPSQDERLPRVPPICDSSLEKAVFTHPAESDRNKKLATATLGQETNYDRLEILGDAYVEVIATQLIWDHFQDMPMPSGRMSQIREDLVKNETLAGFASQYGFDQRVSAPSELRAQSKRWVKVRADVFEAYIAAVALSNPVDGFEMVKKWLGQLWLPRLALVGPEKSRLRSKEQLANKVMGKGTQLRYVEEQPSKQLEGGMQTFYIGVYLTGWGWHDQHLGSGSGLSKAAAGDQAAEQALQNSPLIDQVAAAKAAFYSR